MEDWNREIPTLIGIKQTKNPNQQVIINGIPVESSIHVIHCPHCGLVLFNFDHPGMTKQNIISWCIQNKQVLGENNKYCPKCGNRIRFYTEEPIEAEIVEVVEKLEEEPNGEPEVTEENI